MNNVNLAGRLTADPTIRISGDLKVAGYTLAVDRDSKDGGADFIRCVTFRKSAEFAEKYLKKGMKIIVEGRIQTGSYQKEDGTKIYTTDVIVNRHEFCEKKGESAEKPAENASDEAKLATATADKDGFIDIPAGIDEELPFM